MNPLGDAGSIERLAARCGTAADHLDDIGRRWDERLSTASWECSKADRYRDRMRGRRADAHRHADGLRRLAADLRSYANWVERTSEEVAGWERRIHGWISSATNAAESAAGHVWPIPGISPHLPASGTLEWSDLAAQLRRRGISL